MDIYLEDLEDLPFEKVIEAIRWSRKNTNRFPQISELREWIEGDPDELAERDWTALKAVLAVGPEATVTVVNPVFAEAIRRTWGAYWSTVHQAFTNLQDVFATQELKKTFKRHYLSAYKIRDELREGRTFLGLHQINIDRGTLYGDAVLCTYQVADDKHTLASRKTIKDPSYGETVPMPPELRARLDSLMVSLGKPVGEQLAAQSFQQPSLRPLRDARGVDRPGVHVPGADATGARPPSDPHVKLHLVRDAGDPPDGAAHVSDDPLPDEGATLHE